MCFRSEKEHGSEFENEHGLRIWERTWAQDLKYTVQISEVTNIGHPCGCLLIGPGVYSRQGRTCTVHEADATVYVWLLFAEIWHKNQTNSVASTIFFGGDPDYFWDSAAWCRVLGGERNKICILIVTVQHRLASVWECVNIRCGKTKIREIKYFKQAVKVVACLLPLIIPIFQLNSPARVAWSHINPADN